MGCKLLLIAFFSVNLVLKKFNRFSPEFYPIAGILSYSISQGHKKMKEMLKRLIVVANLAAPIRFFLGRKVGATASIEPIIPFLKKHFKDYDELSVLEIGARYGDSSERIMLALNVKSYVIVDPYDSYDDYENDGFDQVLKSRGGDSVYEQTSSRLKPLIENLRFIRGFSSDKNVIRQLSNEKFDLIFVDGNHEFKYVLEDLENYFPMLTEGGVLCGDDFHSRSKENDWLGTLPVGENRPMVYEAVERFSEISGLEYLTFGEHRDYPKTFAFLKTEL